MDMDKRVVMPFGSLFNCPKCGAKETEWVGSEFDEPIDGHCGHYYDKYECECGCTYIVTFQTQYIGTFIEEN